MIQTNVDVATKGKSDAPSHVQQHMRMSNNYQESDMEALVQEKHQVMGFVDENPVHIISQQYEQDPTMHYVDFQDASLKEFFERPIRINSGLWTVGSHLEFTFNPWQDYFSNTSVSKKLDNYHMMRANLHIKVMVNGTPFHYSRLIVAYQPLPVLNDNHRVSGYTKRQTIMKLSMLPHGFVDPSVQSPLEMTLPFINPQNYITTAGMVNALANSNPNENLGKVHVESTTPLNAVSATAALNIPYTVFAWATEVELVIPTSTIVSASKRGKRKSTAKPYGGTTKDNVFGRIKNKAAQKVASLSQMDVPPDEKKDGIISGVSSIVASAAGKLTDVPFIGDAARITKGVANGVTSVARFFGYSRPMVMTDANYVKRLPFSSTALTIGNETVSKVSFDPKQNITIDPAVTAMGCEDELHISMFTNKETLIETVPWSNSDAADSLLYWVNVEPADVAREPVDPDIDFVMPSSLTFASFPFQYWSGSLIYRFQFVSSAYHTGRVRITFEPDGVAYDATSFNTTYSQVVDLATGTDVSFVVPWAQTVPYKEVTTNLNFSSAWPIDVYLPTRCNGRVYISVLNELISPDVTKDISINVFVRAADDYELAVPKATWETGTTIGDRIQYNISASGEGNKSLSPEKLTMLFGEPLTEEEITEKSSVFFGERVTSFRPLIKRYEYAGTRYGSKDASYNEAVTHKVAGMIYPPIYGMIDTPGTGKGTYSRALQNGVIERAFNYNPTSLLSYLSSSFLGTRGSVRWKFIPFMPTGVPTALQATRYATGLPTLDDNADLYSQAALNVEPTSSVNEEANRDRTQFVSSIWNGSVVYPGKGGQPGIELEIPWYNPLRFTSTSVNVMGTYNGELGDNHSNSQWMITASCQPSTDASLDSQLGIDTFCAAGEDFTLNFYLGPTMMYFIRDLAPP